MEITNKYLPYLIILNLILLINGCQTLNQEGNNPPSGTYLRLSCKNSVLVNENFNLDLSYSINSSCNLILKIFMEDSIYYRSSDTSYSARCNVYNSIIQLDANSSYKSITLNPSSNFYNQTYGDTCNCFPSGINNRTYKIYAEILNYYLKDSIMLTVGINRYKVDYYFVNDAGLNYDILTKDSIGSHWFKISGFFNNTVNTKLYYPSDTPNHPYYTGYITYNHGIININNIQSSIQFFNYLNSNGIPVLQQGGRYEKDKDILLGFGSVKFGITNNDPTAYAATIPRTSRYDNADGRAAFSYIDYPKLNGFFISHGVYDETDRDLYRRALVVHELGHGRSSDCYAHSPNDMNCIMNIITYNDNKIHNPFIICNYHKFMIQRRFWFPGNINF